MGISDFACLCWKDCHDPGSSIKFMLQFIINIMRYVTLTGECSIGVGLLLTDLDKCRGYLL